LKSWFFIDLTSTIPFDYIVEGTQKFNQLARIAKLPRLYKLIRMSRLVRMLKIVKDRNKLVKYLSEVLKIGIGFERMLFFILIFFVLCHIACCFWVMSASFNDYAPYTWVGRGDY
jgi:hypothetical protein